MLLKQEQDELHRSKYEADIQQQQQAINNLVFDMYELTTEERHLVEDMVHYGIAFFNWSQKKGRKPHGTDAVRPPTRPMLIAYAQTFIDVTTALLRYQDETLNAVVYHNGAPLSVVGFERVQMDNAQEVQFIEDHGQLRDMLRHLDLLLCEKKAPALYMRRHVRIYDGSMVHLVRPSEQRFWSRSQAYADADSFLADMLTYSKREVGKIA